MPDGGETWAIIVGAGAGDRLGADRPKAFVRFRGRTLLASSLAVFDDHPGIDGIVCVVPAGYEDRATLVVDDLLADKVSAAVAGGATRAGSVSEGLVAVPESAAYVLVHDAARPLVTSGVIDRVLAGLATGAEAVIPGVPLVDTVKRVEGGRVDRDPAPGRARRRPDAPGLPARSARRGARGGLRGSDRLRVAGRARRAHRDRGRGRSGQLQDHHARGSRARRDAG